MNNWELSTDAKEDLLMGNQKFCKGGILSFDEIHFSEKEGICLYFKKTLVATLNMEKSLSLAMGDTVILQGFLGTMRITLD